MRSSLPILFKLHCHPLTIQFCIQHLDVSFLQLCLNLHSSCSCALVSSANILVRALVVDYPTHTQLTLIFILWYLYLYLKTNIKVTNMKKYSREIC